MPDVSDISNSLITLENELSKLRSATNIIEDAKDLLTQSIETTTSLVREVTETSEMVVKGSREAVNEAVRDTISVHQASEELTENVRDLIQEIHGFDIPSHFQHLESKILELDSKIKNLNTRTESMERKILDEFESNIKIITSKMKSSTTFQIITSSLILLITASILILLILSR